MTEIQPPERSNIQSGILSGTTAQYGGTSGSALFAIHILRISRLAPGKPVKYADVTDVKLTRQPTP